MTYPTSHSPPCPPSSSCPCRHNQPIGHLNPSPTHPSAYKGTLTAPGQVLDARGAQQNNCAPLLPSVMRSVTRPSTTTRNDAMTGTRPDSVQLARGYAQMNFQIQQPTFAGFSEYLSDTTNGQRGNVGRGSMHSNSSLETESPTPRQAGTKGYDYPSPHPNAIEDTRNWGSTSSTSSLTPVSLPARTFVSSISPQLPAALPPTQNAHPRSNPYRGAGGASLDRVLRNLGRWLSNHDYLNTGQDPIIGHDCPLEYEALGIKGKTVLTAFFDHTDRKTFTCYVCPDVSHNLEAAIMHQRRAMHHQD